MDKTKETILYSALQDVLGISPNRVDLLIDKLIKAGVDPHVIGQEYPYDVLASVPGIGIKAIKRWASFIKPFNGRVVL